MGLAPGDEWASSYRDGEESGRAQGRLAGLKEAEQIADEEYLRGGDTRSALAVLVRIRARISILEKGTE